MMLLLAAHALACTCNAGLLDVGPNDVVVGTDAAVLTVMSPGFQWFDPHLVSDTETLLLEPVETWDMRDRTYTFWRPADPLDADTRYGVFFDEDEWTAFETGPGPEAVPAEAPVLTAWWYEDWDLGDEGCGPLAYLSVEADAGPLLEFEVTRGDDVWSFVGDTDEAFGDAGCTHNWGEVAPGPGYTVRARRRNHAGATGPWSEPLAVPYDVDEDVVPQPERGCATVGGGGPWWLVVLGLGYRRVQCRRRRSQGT